MTMDNSDYLHATPFIDSDDPAIQAFARRAAGNARTVKDKAIALYRAVRDSIQYDPYIDFFDPAEFRASAVLHAGKGFCVGKSAVLAAAARVCGIPARPGYADVRNHLTSQRLRDRVGDTFCWHSYTELIYRRKMGQVHAGLRLGAVRARENQAARFRRRERQPVPSVRPGRTAAHGISQGPRRISPTCRSQRSWRISRSSIPSFAAANPAAASFRDEVTT